MPDNESRLILQDQELFQKVAQFVGNSKRARTDTSEITRLIPSISQKMLVQQLRELDAHGLIGREVFRQVPPRVDYSATALGLSLEPVTLALCDWGQRHAEALDEAERMDTLKVLERISDRKHVFPIVVKPGVMPSA